MNRNITGIGAIVAGLLIIIGLHTFFAPCAQLDDGNWMRCHWSAQAEIGVGALITAIGMLLLLIPARQIRLGLSISLALSGILVIAIPKFLIGGCGMPSMHCQSVTFPVLVIIGFVIVFAFTFNVLYLFLYEKKGSGKEK